MAKKKIIDTYDHSGEKRKNNPPVGLVSAATDELNGKTLYAHDPHIDPHLSWAGKKEKPNAEAKNISLHTHERIDAHRIIQSFLKNEAAGQPSLFDDSPPLNKAVEFYQHEEDWTNRLIAGDSLLVMNSLLQKEKMAGDVQMIYIDPPYGIKYNSNFQPFVNKREVRDGDDKDLSTEPEMLRAFHDTWELGIHSYLSYLRDRLLLAKDLLKNDGSIFVQINDENLHFVRAIMDEIFGAKNFINIIPFRKKTSPQECIGVTEMFDYLVWHAKDKSCVEISQLYVPRNLRKPGNEYHYQDVKGERVAVDTYKISESEWSGIYRTGAGVGKRQNREEYRFELEVNGKKLFPPAGYGWIEKKEGMENLIKAGRLHGTGMHRLCKIFYDDFPYEMLSNVWTDLSAAQSPNYVVQTDVQVVQRCMLMTTKPGDLVLDLTCGSGTTAYVAEQWGRRWMTCDTSRIALTLAKQRLMTSTFDYYQLENPKKGIGGGFAYKTAPHITLKSIARGERPKPETLYDQPLKINGKIRVTGPFTVEAVPSLRVSPADGNLPTVEGNGRELARTGETGRLTAYCDKLQNDGIRTQGGKKIEFSAVRPLPTTKFLHAEGEVLENNRTKKAVISFGPDFAPLEQRQVEEAIKEAGKMKDKAAFVVFAAFHFDPEAAKDIKQAKIKDAQILQAQMSIDMLTEDLRKKDRKNQGYWLIGQPDIEILPAGGKKYKVRVAGFDYYDPISGEVESKSNQHIAMWFLDVNYDDRSLFPAQVFFPVQDKKRDWTKLAKTLNGNIDEDRIGAFAGVESLPFEAGDKKKIAVKIIDDRGIESFVVKELE